MGKYGIMPKAVCYKGFFLHLETSLDFSTTDFSTDAIAICATNGPQSAYCAVYHSEIPYKRVPSINDDKDVFNL